MSTKKKRQASTSTYAEGVFSSCWRRMASLIGPANVTLLGSSLAGPANVTLLGSSLAGPANVTLLGGFRRSARVAQSHGSASPDTEDHLSHNRHCRYHLTPEGRSSLQFLQVCSGSSMVRLQVHLHPRTLFPSDAMILVSKKNQFY